MDDALRTSGEPSPTGGGGVVGGEDAGHVRTPVNGHTKVEGDLFDRPNDAHEPALWVLHTVNQVQVAHEMVHRRSAVWAGPQKHGVVAQNLA